MRAEILGPHLLPPGGKVNAGWPGESFARPANALLGVPAPRPETTNN